MVLVDPCKNQFIPVSFHSQCPVDAWHKESILGVSPKKTATSCQISNLYGRFYGDPLSYMQDQIETFTAKFMGLYPTGCQITPCPQVFQGLE